MDAADQMVHSTSHLHVVDDELKGCLKHDCVHSPSVQTTTLSLKTSAPYHQPHPRSSASL